MKYICVILFLSTFTLTAQSGNFSVIKNNVVWHKSYDSKAAEFIDVLRYSGEFEEIQAVKDGLFTFKIKKHNGNKFKPYGYVAEKDAAFLKNDCYATGKFEFKADKYEITIYQLLFFNKEKGNKLASMNEFLIKNGKLNDSKTVKKALEYYDKFFTNLFTPKKKSKK